MFNQEKKSDGYVLEKGFNFEDPRLMCGAWRNENNPDIYKVYSVSLFLFFIF